MSVEHDDAIEAEIDAQEAEALERVRDRGRCCASCGREAVHQIEKSDSTHATMLCMACLEAMAIELKRAGFDCVVRDVRSNKRFLVVPSKLAAGSR
jgi:hypothetical protein